MQLCTYSKSSVLEHLIIKECPLDLTYAEHRTCLCRQRQYSGDLRVLTCQFPNTWRGEPIRDPKAFVASMRDRRSREAEQQREKQGKPKRPQQRERSQRPMTTEAAAKPANPATEPTSSNLAVRPAGGLSPFANITDPQTMNFLEWAAKAFFNSKSLGCTSPDQARLLAMHVYVTRTDPLDFGRRNDIIGGRISMKAATMLADFRTKCGGNHVVLSHTPDKAAIELKIGKQKQVFEFTWTEALGEDYVLTKDALSGKTPKFLGDGQVNPAALKDNWSTPRRRAQMLWARVVSDGVRVMAPEVNYGLYTPEELGGTADEIDDDSTIDGEFSVTDSQQVDQASQKQAAPATEPKADSSSPAQERVSEPAESTDSAAPSNAESTTTDPQPDSRPTHDENGVPYAVSRDKLRVLKELKDRLLTDEQWAKVLEKYGVTKAGQLTAEQADKIHAALLERQRRADQQAAAKRTDEGDEPAF